jgi:hypothetical protein
VRERRINVEAIKRASLNDLAALFSATKSGRRISVDVVPLKFGNALLCVRHDACERRRVFLNDCVKEDVLLEYFKHARSLRKLLQLATDEQYHRLLAFACQRFRISHITLDAFIVTLPPHLSHDTQLALLASGPQKRLDRDLQSNQDIGYDVQYPIVIGGDAMQQLPAPVLALATPASLQARDAQRVAYYTSHFRAPGTIANWSPPGDRSCSTAHATATSRIP